MPEQSVIVWDLETIPDLEAAARMLDMGHASDAEVREALGPGFPKHPLHKIVCIGVPASSSDFLSAPLFFDFCAAVFFDWYWFCDVPSLRSDHGARTADCHSSGEPRP